MDPFAETELKTALGRLAAGKAMPSTSAPAALWKVLAPQVVQTLITTTFAKAPPHSRSSLTSVLKFREVSIRLKLLLWQGTVLPTLLHGWVAQDSLSKKRPK